MPPSVECSPDCIELRGFSRYSALAYRTNCLFFYEQSAVWQIDRNKPPEAPAADTSIIHKKYTPISLRKPGYRRSDRGSKNPSVKSVAREETRLDAPPTAVVEAADADAPPPIAAPTDAHDGDTALFVLHKEEVTPAVGA